MFWTRIDEMGIIFDFAFTKKSQYQKWTLLDTREAPSISPSRLYPEVYFHICVNTQLFLKDAHFSKTSR